MSAPADHHVRLSGSRNNSAWRSRPERSLSRQGNRAGRSNGLAGPIATYGDSPRGARAEPSQREKKRGCIAATPRKIGAPGRIRTHDPLVRSQVLYPTELRARRPRSYHTGQGLPGVECPFTGQATAQSTKLRPEVFGPDQEKSAPQSRPKGPASGRSACAPSLKPSQCEIVST
jgi:hypothetical protein